MDYQKIITFYKNTPNQPPKIRTRNCVEINDDSYGTYNANSQIKFEASILKSNLCDYSDAYILAKGTITVQNTTAANNGDKKVIFKNFASFTDCISETSNAQVDNA